MEATITQVNMVLGSIMDLVIAYRDSAVYRRCETSSAITGDVLPCTDKEVGDFIACLSNGVNTAKLRISDIDIIANDQWADDYCPVDLCATKLPDGRYFLELIGYELHKEFIYQSSPTRD